MRKQDGLPATPSQVISPTKQGEVTIASGLRGGRGQTLLEILLAFGVSVLVLSAVVMSIITSLSNAQYTKNQGLANSYAQQGMAVVRQLRDSSWTDFNSRSSGNYCLGDNATELPSSSSSSCEQNLANIFSRAVKIERTADDCSQGTPPPPIPTPPVILKGNKVTVTVSWSDSKCSVGDPLCHKVELITCLSNIDQNQSP